VLDTMIFEINNQKTMSGDLGMSRRILQFPFPYQGHINPMRRACLFASPYLFVVL